MQIYDDLISIYRDCFFRNCKNGDIISIVERDGKPKVKGIDIELKSDVTFIDSEFLHKTTSSFYKDNIAKPELQHDCDGILLVKYQNTDFLVLLELKSEYNKSNIVKAEKQLTASHMRILTMLMPFLSFNCYSCKTCGIIVSLPIGTEVKRSIKNKHNTKNDLSMFEKQSEYFISKSTPYELDDKFMQIGTLPIHSQYVKNPLPIFHAEANEGITNIDIYSFLRKL